MTQPDQPIIQRAPGFEDVARDAIAQPQGEISPVDPSTVLGHPTNPYSGASEALAAHMEAQRADRIANIAPHVGQIITSADVPKPAVE